MLLVTNRPRSWPFKSEVSTRSYPDCRMQYLNLEIKILSPLSSTTSFFTRTRRRRRRRGDFASKANRLDDPFAVGGNEGNKINLDQAAA